MRRTIVPWCAACRRRAGRSAWQPSNKPGRGAAVRPAPMVVEVDKLKDNLYVLKGRRWE